MRKFTVFAHPYEATFDVEQVGGGGSASHITGEQLIAFLRAAPLACESCGRGFESDETPTNYYGMPHHKNCAALREAHS